MKESRSIRWRMVAALAGVSLFTLVVVGVVFYVFLGDYVIERQRELLLDQAVEVAEQAQGLSETLQVDASRAKMLAVLLRADMRLLPPGSGIAVFSDSTLVAKAGSMPAKGEYLERLRAEAQRVGGTAPGTGVTRSLTSGAGRKLDVIVAAAPIELADGARGLAVVILSRADAFAVRTGVFRTLLIAGAIAIGLAVLVGLGLGAWMTRPLRRLSTAARAMAAGSYEQPVTGSYPGEVQELATSLETMRQEVQRSEDSLRGFVASAAHELRTPLTSIQGFSQALLDGTAATPVQQQRAAAAVYRESTRLQRLVEALLTLSRYDSHEFEPNMTTVAVDSLVREEVGRLVQADLATPDRITVQVDGDALVVTDGDMLRQVIANLLRNAVQYGGTEPVTARVWTEGGELLLEVANGGEPLTAEEKKRIFARFYRGCKGVQGDGFGLGLALVWEICDVLGGRVELVEGGPLTRFRVTLPISRGT